MNIVMLLLGLVLSSTFVSSLSAPTHWVPDAEQRSERPNAPVEEVSTRTQCSQLGRLPCDQASAAPHPAAGCDPGGCGDSLGDSMYRSAVLTHPLFVLWESFSTSTFQGLTDMCDFSILRSRRRRLPGWNQMLSGRLPHEGRAPRTRSLHDSSVVAFSRTGPVEPDTWLCEAAIWCDWIHVGGAATTESSQLLVVEASRVVEVANEHRIISDVTREYCRQFHLCASAESLARRSVCAFDGLGRHHSFHAHSGEDSDRLARPGSGHSSFPVVWATCLRV